jgi:hypothetical protein
MGLRTGDATAIGRADFLRLATTAAAAGLVSAAMPTRLVGRQAPTDAHARIASLIEEYDRQGIHRTATDTDSRSAEWLAEHARRAGADVSLEAFPVSRVDLRSSFVQVGERRIEALPLFDGAFTDERGISARLGFPGTGAEIALVEIDAAGISSEGRPLAELRRGNQHKALVIVTNGAHPGLTPMNAPAFREPLGPPALQVASDAAGWLEAEARKQTEIHFVAHADRTPASARNVVAQVSGRHPDLAPLVVMTPRSGWWQCAAERGGGLACWVEAVRAIGGGSADRTILFVASSGHELGHLGLDSFIAGRRDLVTAARAWIHLGANIGAAGGQARVQASDDQLEEMLLAALTRAATGVPQRVPRATIPAGEARNIHAGRGQYVSLLGSSRFFHSPADRWPTSVDVLAVARFAVAIADLTAQLASRVV